MAPAWLDGTLAGLYHELLERPVLWMINAIRNPKPRPKSVGEGYQLRHRAKLIVKESLERGIETDRSTEEQIERENSIELLRLYVRFIDKYEYYVLASLFDRIHEARTAFRTNLKTSQLTEAHVKAHNFFLNFRSEKIFESGTDISFEEMTAEHKMLDKLDIYALNNIEQADRILSLAHERQIIDVKQIKSLLSIMDESPASPLAEGAL